MDRPPLPPFTLESATQKVRLAEDAWNSRDPGRVAQAYSTTVAGAIAANSCKAAKRSRRS